MIANPSLGARPDVGAARDGSLLAAVLEQMPLGVAIVDAGGELLFTNAAVERILGRPVPALAAARGAAIHAFHLDGRRYEHDELPAVRASRGEPVSGEVCRYERPDGTWRTIGVTSFPVHDDLGDGFAVVTTFEDVSDRERRERAERDFVTNAAHELQSPLAAIIAATDALRSGAKDDPPARELFLDHVHANAERLARLSQALLVLARAQTGLEAAKREVVPLAPLVGKLVARLRPNPRVRVAADVDDDVAALAHPGLLEQVLANLAENALKYTDEGEVVVSAARFAGRVVVEVRDTGRGIEARDRESVRDRFYRGDRATEGFGLGLAIADQAVKALDGTLDIASVPEQGTIVTITLPAARLMRT